MVRRFDYVIERIADALGGTYVGSDHRAGRLDDVTFRATRLKARETLTYCCGLLEGATCVRWYADRSEPMLITFRRSI